MLPKVAEVSFGSLEAKHPSATQVVEFEWFPLLASFWRPGKVVAVGDFVQPRDHTGFSYQRETGTKCGSAEPSWPATIDATVVDGDGTWSAKAGNAGGVQAATSPDVAEATGELTVSGVTVIDGLGASSAVRCTIAGGKSGKVYRLVCTITAGAQVLVGTLLVPCSTNV